MTGWDSGYNYAIEWVKEQIKDKTRIWQIGQETEDGEMEYVDFQDSVIYTDVIKKILEEKK